MAIDWRFDLVLPEGGGGRPYISKSALTTVFLVCELNVLPNTFLAAVPLFALEYPRIHDLKPIPRFTARTFPSITPELSPDFIFLISHRATLGATSGLTL